MERKRQLKYRVNLITWYEIDVCRKRNIKPVKYFYRVLRQRRRKNFVKGTLKAGLQIAVRYH